MDREAWLHRDHAEAASTKRGRWSRKKPHRRAALPRL